MDALADIDTDNAKKLDVTGHREVNDGAFYNFGGHTGTETDA